jgi:hypothetical protein
LFAGASGEATLQKLGAAVIDPATYYQEYVPPPKPAGRKHGTVGAAALDRCGHLAAGTSTGGWPGKLPGRVGDSPIIGASTYAELIETTTGETRLYEEFLFGGAATRIAERFGGGFSRLNFRFQPGVLGGNAIAFKPVGLSFCSRFRVSLYRRVDLGLSQRGYRERRNGQEQSRTDLAKRLQGDKSAKY